MTDQWHSGLTAKQRRFCEAFTSNGGNAVAAAREAGYKNCDPTGAENLGNPRIKTALEALRQSMTQAYIATREERQAFWTATMRDQEADLKIRLKASEILGRAQGDFIPEEQGEPGVQRIVILHRHEGIDTRL